MATELGQAYVQIMPSARGISGKIKAAISPEVESAGQSAGASLGERMVSLAKKAIAVAGIGKFFSASIMEGANLQQSIGGIETLFKGSAKIVKKYADEAYKTTGLSANAYMENVTGFSASLLQSLGGDTRKAADVANMAMIDMADNSNKMGTSMDRIQDAYQGFAKQNYTMLDNLKLGYGGTKTEMERLLADATKITGVKYDINNLSDVYQAIHAIQGDLKITGATAVEASTTFTGSFSAMKAAAQNVLGNLALGKDIGPSLHSLYETAKTFLVGNLIPMIGNVLKGIPHLIYGILQDGLTAVFGEGIAEPILEWVYNTFADISAIANTLFDMIFGSMNKKDNVNFLKSYLGIDEKTASSIVNIGENIRVTFENIGATIGNIAGIVGSFVSDLLGIGGSEQSVNLIASAFEGLTKFLRSASEKLKDFTKWINENKTAMDLVKSALAGALAGFMAFKAVTTVKAIILDFKKAITAVKGAVAAFNAAIAGNPVGAWIVAITAVVAALTWFFTQTETGRKIWSGFVSWIKSAWKGIADFFSGLWKGISDGAINLWNGVVAVWNGVIDGIKSAWEGIKEFFSGLWSGISDGASNAWNGTIEGIKSAWQGISDFFSGLWESITSLATTAWTSITSAVLAIVQPFVDTFMSIWNGMKDGISQVFEGIKIIFTGAWELIKSIVLGAVLFIIDLVTLDFNKLGEDLGLIWDGIKNAISTVWNGICTFFSGIINTIIGFFTGAFEGLKTFLAGVWDAIKSVAETVWNLITSGIKAIIDGFIAGAQAVWDGFKGFLSGLWDGIKSTAISMWNGICSGIKAIIDGFIAGAQAAWNGFKGFMAGLWDGIKSTATNMWNGIKTGTLNIINGLVSGAQGFWDSMKNGVKNLCDGVKNLFSGLAHIDLAGAGKAIMNGFLGGLKAVWGGIQDFVGGIAGWIRKHKGPISYDRKLLIPAGKAIMGGFDESLQESFKGVQKTVGGVAGWISDAVSGDGFDFGNDTAFNRNITSTLQMPNSKYETAESKMVSEIAILRASLDVWLEKISNKDPNTYLDGEKLAINAYQRQGQIMAREGI
ncbi:PblA [Streptococcus gordonii]|uniref:PblA n=1 Tax=Streptococcus gordonii TaxID=1302 RepID=UPI0010E71FC0|nr:PblA [Streptococcus gordonii]VTS24938.1 PblA [Streptococcus gordonii]